MATQGTMENIRKETQKRLLGQFFTIENPLKYDAFQKWWGKADKATKGLHILEPFAGANNIIKLAKEQHINRPWHSFDIAPPDLNHASEFEVKLRDSIKDFPEGKIVITNPPYLAKNSATRRGLPFPDTDYGDLYQVALKKMLDHCDWVAAIIPASFLTQGVLQERTTHVTQLSCRMFADTDCPVCLATFGPEKTDDFEVYSKNEFLGMFRRIKDSLPSGNKSHIAWEFNNPFGEIGLRAVDNNKSASIEFTMGSEITTPILPSSRSITRIKSHTKLSLKEVETIVEKANQLLFEYREKSRDILLTPFKGLREDGEFRRRLDFKQARQLLDAAL